MSNEPVAWRYEAATAVFESGEYGGWQCTISEKEPCAPENSIRNLQPLYTHPVDDTALLRRALDALEMFANCDAFIPSIKKQSADDEDWDISRRESVYGAVERAITALRERLGEKA